MKRALLVVPLVLAACASDMTAPSESAVMLRSRSKAPVAALRASCATIKDGTIKDSWGNVLVSGYDEFGYNYQAHQFIGTNDGVDRILGNDLKDEDNDKLVMKWSNDWLSDSDCNNDGKLDRGTSGTSLGWLTNHYEGDFDSDANGVEDAHYTYFAKMVWVGPGGPLWGQYKLIQEISNAPVDGLHGNVFRAVRPGFGLNDHWTKEAP